jgi:hypothetical protein
MRLDDEKELASLRNAFASGSQETPAPAVCPAPEKVWDAVHGKLPADEVREIVQHTAACAACAEDWRLAHMMQGQEEAVEAVPAPLRFAPRSVSFHRLRTFGLAAAAALALVFVGVQYFQAPQQQGPKQSDTYREEPRQIKLESLVPAGTPLDRDHFVLRWTAPVAGATYIIRVTTEEDTRPVASVEGLKAAEYQVPASALKDIPGGSRLLWRVEADLPESGHVSSPTFETPVQ